MVNGNNDVEKELKEFRKKQEAARKERRILRKAIEGIEKEKALKKEVREKKIKVVKEKIGKIEKGVGKTLRSLERGIVAGETTRRKEALQAEIVRTKLLQAITDKKKRVSILARIEDKIPSVFINGEKRQEPQRKQLSFLGKGGVL